MELVEAGFKPDVKTFELEAIQGGWVELVRLNHGESNELTDLTLQFTPAEEEDTSGQARTTTKIGRHYSFSHCIRDHNLGHDGKKCDFKKRRDVDELDPVVGDEIARLIGNHNESLDEGDIPNSNED